MEYCHSIQLGRDPNGFTQVTEIVKAFEECHIGMAVAPRLINGVQSDSTFPDVHRTGDEPGFLQIDQLF